YVVSPSDQVGAQHARGKACDDVLENSKRRAADGTLAAADQFPDFVRNPTVGQVREESENVARRHSAEKIANHISDRGAPRGRGTEQERADNRNRVGGAKFGDAGN